MTVQTRRSSSAPSINQNFWWRSRWTKASVAGCIVRRSNSHGFYSQSICYAADLSVLGFQPRYGAGNHRVYGAGAPADVPADGTAAAFLDGDAEAPA